MEDIIIFILSLMVFTVTWSLILFGFYKYLGKQSENNYNCGNYAYKPLQTEDEPRLSNGSRIVFRRPHRQKSVQADQQSVKRRVITPLASNYWSHGIRKDSSSTDSENNHYNTVDGHSTNTSTKAKQELWSPTTKPKELDQPLKSFSEREDQIKEAVKERSESPNGRGQCSEMARVANGHKMGKDSSLFESPSRNCVIEIQNQLSLEPDSNEDENKKALSNVSLPLMEGPTTEELVKLGMVADARPGLVSPSPDKKTFVDLPSVMEDLPDITDDGDRFHPIPEVSKGKTGVKPFAFLKIKTL